MYLYIHTYTIKISTQRTRLVSVVQAIITTVLGAFLQGRDPDQVALMAKNASEVSKLGFLVHIRRGWNIAALSVVETLLFSLLIIVETNCPIITRTIDLQSIFIRCKKIRCLCGIHAESPPFTTVLKIIIFFLSTVHQYCHEPIGRVENFIFASFLERSVPRQTRYGFRSRGCFHYNAQGNERAVR